MLEEIKQARECNKRVAELDANLAVIEEHWEVIDSPDCELVTKAGGKVRAVRLTNYRDTLKARLANAAKPILAELQTLHQPPSAVEELPPIAGGSDVLPMKKTHTA